MLENLVKAGAPSFFPYVKTIGGGTGGFTSQGVVSGFHNGRHKFLPFVANGINSVETQGQDVISAHFSGCIMAVYNDKGVTKVCHVSTGADFGDCKAAWDAAKSAFTNVFEFRPSDFIGDNPCTKCYGLITSDLQTYTILVDSPRVERAQGGYAQADDKFVKIIKSQLLR